MEPNLKGPLRATVAMIVVIAGLVFSNSVSAGPDTDMIQDAPTTVLGELLKN